MLMRMMPEREEMIPIRCWTVIDSFKTKWAKTTNNTGAAEAMGATSDE